MHPETRRGQRGAGSGAAPGRRAGKALLLAGALGAVLFLGGIAAPAAEEEPSTEAVEAAEAEESAESADGLRQLRIGLEELVLQIASVRERLAASETERRSLAAELDQVRRARDGALAANEAAAAARSELEARLADSERALKSAHDELIELSRRLEESASREAELDSAVAAAEKERDEEAERVRRQSAASAELEAEKLESDRALQTARGELAELSRLLEESEAERERLAAAEEDSAKVRDLANARIADLTEEIESLRAFFELVRQQTMPEEERDISAANPAPEVAEGGASPGEAASVQQADPELGADRGRSVVTLVEKWASAWSEQRVEDYLAFYASSFRPSGGLLRAEWETRRRERITAPEWIEVRVAVLDVRVPSSERAEVELMQSYSSDRLNDTVIKTLELVRENEAWKIAAENTR